MQFVTTSVTTGAPFLFVLVKALMNTPSSAASKGDSLASTV